MDTGIQLTYLLSAILFVVGLKRLQSPATARKGNGLAALAMLLAIIATVLETGWIDWTWILVGVVIGGTSLRFLPVVVVFRRRRIGQLLKHDRLLAADVCPQPVVTELFSELETDIHITKYIMDRRRCCEESLTHCVSRITFHPCSSLVNAG